MLSEHNLRGPRPVTVFGNLDRLPGSPQLHRWADWAELLCLDSEDGRLSIPTLTASVESRESELHVDLDDEMEPDQRLADELAGIFDSPAQFRDAVATRSSDVFAYMASRAAHYGDMYPFDVDVNSRRMTIRDLTESRLVYVFLLGCASFRYVPEKAHQVSMAARFELLCLEAMKRVMPAHAQVHLFGSNSVWSGSRYHGALAGKVKLLASDLREKVVVDLAEFHPMDSGDNGLDIVAWIPAGDDAPGMLSVFGQCACTPKWVEKQHSSSNDAWDSVIRLTVQPVNYCFAPFDFRKPDGSWYLSHSIHKSVLMDRRRLASALALVGGQALPQELVALLSLNEFLTPTA